MKLSMLALAAVPVTAAWGYSQNVMARTKGIGIANTERQCPDGFNYEWSITFGVLGSNAYAFQDLASSFFDAHWMPIGTGNYTGTDKVPGCTRTYDTETAVGDHRLTEHLDYYEVWADGSFVQTFSLQPFGDFGGWTIIIDSRYVLPHMTSVAWSVEACNRAPVFDYAQYHEDALKNAANILEKAGQIKGPQKEPYSFQSFEVNGAQKHMEM